MFSSRAGAHPALEARPSYSQCFLCLLRGHCWRAFHLPVPWASSAKMSKSPVPLPPNNLCLCPSSPAWVSCNSLLSDLSCSPCSFALQPTLHGTKLLFSLSYLFLATLRSMWNFSDHESNPRPLQWKPGILTTVLLGRFHNIYFQRRQCWLACQRRLMGHRRPQEGLYLGRPCNTETRWLQPGCQV